MIAWSFSKIANFVAGLNFAIISLCYGLLTVGVSKNINQHCYERIFQDYQALRPSL